MKPTILLLQLPNCSPENHRRLSDSTDSRFSTGNASLPLCAFQKPFAHTTTGSPRKTSPPKTNAHKEKEEVTRWISCPKHLRREGKFFFDYHNDSNAAGRCEEIERPGSGNRSTARCRHHNLCEMREVWTNFIEVEIGRKPARVSAQ